MRVPDRALPGHISPAAAIGLLAAVQVVLVWWSWGRWLDPLVDFGRELYLPWQISEGRVLYRDLASFNGPLSPYLNALWFSVGGVRLHTIAVANTAIAVALAGLLCSLLRRFCSTPCALVASSAFVLVFSVSHTLPIGNYNFITPYAHELTHGIVLAVLALWCLARYAIDERPWALPAAGVAAGLVLLTKVEVAAAAWLALVVTLAARHRLSRASGTGIVREWAVFLISATAPPVAAVLLFAQALPVANAAAVTFSHWRIAFDADVTSHLAELPFYRAISGLDDPTGRLMELAWWTAIYAAVLGAAAAVSRFSTRDGRSVVPPVAVFVGTLVVAIALTMFVDDRPARPLPLLTLGLALLFGHGILVHRRGGMGAALHLGWIVFAAGLLIRMALNPRLAHYGFALAMPAFLNAIVFLLDWLPRRLKTPAAGRSLQAAALALLAVVAVSTLWSTAREFDRKTVRVGSGADAFWADTRGREIQLAVEHLARKVDGNQTLVVLPEGVMINYLSRTPSSVRVLNFMPPELIIFGEDRILTELEAARPRYVALVHKDTTEYGARFFGRDYGALLLRWVEEHYRAVRSFGADPLRDERFGIVLLERTR